VASATNTESFGSGKVGPSFANSKGFFIFSTKNASSNIDFSRALIDEEVVESPPSKEIGQTPLYSIQPSRSSGNNRFPYVFFFV
jgi:hypothetical protein